MAKRRSLDDIERSVSKKLVPYAENLQKKAVKAIQSPQAALLAGSAIAGALLATGASGELGDRLGVPQSKSRTKLEQTAARLQASVENVTGSLLVTGSAIGNTSMAAIGVGTEAGIALGKQVEVEAANIPEPKAPPAPTKLMGYGVRRDLGRKAYEVQKIEVPDNVPSAVKYKMLGDILCKIAVEGSNEPTVIRAAKEITAGAVTPEEKALAVAQWVKRNVRYVLDEKNPKALRSPDLFKREPDGSLEIFQYPSHTLSSRVADCDDQSLLVTALLRAVGVYTKWRLISQDPENPEVYSHIFPVAVFKGGTEMPLDTTPIIGPLGMRSYIPFGAEAENTGHTDVLPQPLPQNVQEGEGASPGPWARPLPADRVVSPAVVTASSRFSTVDRPSSSTQDPARTRSRFRDSTS